MHDIFAAAQEIIAWAGEDGIYGQRALKFLNILFREMLALKAERIQVNIMTVTSRPGCEWPSTDWTALKIFLRRPFFHRIWIVQEMVVSSRTFLVCGASSCWWEPFLRSIDMLNRHGLSSLICPTENPNDTGFRGTYRSGFESLATINGFRALVKGAKPPPLAIGLLIAPYFECTDPRDRTFALRQISAERHDQSLRSNYHQTVHSSFTQTASHLLQQDATSMILLYGAGVGQLRNLDGLPSWVPDWTRPRKIRLFGLTAEFVSMDEEDRFRAGLSDFSHARVQFEPSSLSLIVAARVFDAIGIVERKPLVKVLRNASGGKTSLGNALFWIDELSRLILPMVKHIRPKSLSFLTFW
jgi:hypothetical protein